MKRTHELKSDIPIFDDLAKGIKSFELRKDDRDFQVGDKLVLREYNHKSKTFTGRYVIAYVSYVFRYDDPTWGLLPGYCIMGLRDIELSKEPHEREDL